MGGMSTLTSTPDAPSEVPSEAPSARLSPLVIACLAATWLVWGSTYLAIKFALLSFPPFFGSNRSTAFIRPMFPSEIRSSSGRP